MFRAANVTHFRNRLETLAAATDQQPALDDGRECLTYSELLERVAAMEERLAEAGAERVAYRLPNGVPWIVLDLALLFSQRVAVPVPDFFSDAQVAHVLQIAGIDTFITTGATADCDLHWDRRAVPENTPAPHVHTAKISFTSGTTGTPKGVCLDAATLLTTACGLVEVVAPLGISRHLSVLPLPLLLENVAGVYANLYNGGCVCVPPLDTLGIRGSSDLDALAFAAGQSRWQPQSAILVPQLLLALTALADACVELPTSYRFLAVGGARVAPDLLRRARGAGLPAFEGYGLTETGSVIALNRPGSATVGSAGVPLPGVQLSTEDREVCVACPRMLGYLGEPPLLGAVRTADIGRLDADGLYLEGRRAHRITTSFGRNLSPEWVESELHGELSIALACVFGDGQPENVALIVPRGGASDAQVTEALERCNARLPDYARVARWQRISIHQLRSADCLSPVGKPRRTAITRRFDRELTALFGADDHLQTRPQKLEGAKQ